MKRAHSVQKIGSTHILFRDTGSCTYVSPIASIKLETSKPGNDDTTLWCNGKIISPGVFSDILDILNVKSKTASRREAPAQQGDPHP
jgi:hypothetical protein